VSVAPQLAALGSAPQLAALGSAPQLAALGSAPQLAALGSAPQLAAGDAAPYRCVVRNLLLLFSLLLLPAPGLAARLSGLSVTPGVVTIVADGLPAVAHAFALADPQRLVIDLPAVVPAALAAPGAGSVSAVRAAMFAPGVARLVIDLSAPLEIVSARRSATGLTITLRRVPAADFADVVRRGRRPLSVMPDKADTPNRPAPRASADFSLPAQLFGPRIAPAPAPSSAPPRLPTPAQPGQVTPAQLMPAQPGQASPMGQPVRTQPLPPAAAPAGAPSKAEPVLASAVAADAGALAKAATIDAGAVLPAEAGQVAAPSRQRASGIRPRSGGKPLVVIDAGHGGKDAGAISVLGGYEKDVTLAIARLTARRLERGGRVRVKLTRDDDRFIPLGGRVRIARDARADLFISIHADAAPNAEARGASVYTLSAVASDAVAARLAARENKADIIGGVNLGVEAPEVGDIMIDLSRRATGNVSVQFADILQDALSERLRFRGEFHHFAGFQVLKAPDVPSVLLETGYVTNRDDARLLFSGSARQKIADGIARAIERHLIGD
jgi:N-acetylmuramoyl-L-alanine amidase